MHFILIMKVIIILWMTKLFTILLCTSVRSRVWAYGHESSALRHNQTNSPPYYTLSAIVCVKIFVGLAQFVHSKILYSFSTCNLMVSWCISYSDMKVFIILWMTLLFTIFSLSQCEWQDLNPRPYRYWGAARHMVQLTTPCPLWFVIKNICRIGPVCSLIDSI